MYPDQAAEDGFSADLASVEVLCREAGRMVFSVGDALAGPLMRAGGVVVLPILGLAKDPRSEAEVPMSVG
jgi:hypothetical protein